MYFLDTILLEKVWLWSRGCCCKLSVDFVSAKVCWKSLIERKHGRLWIFIHFWSWPVPHTISSNFEPTRPVHRMQWFFVLRAWSSCLLLFSCRHHCFIWRKSSLNSARRLHNLLCDGLTSRAVDSSSSSTTTKTSNKLKRWAFRLVPSIYRKIDDKSPPQHRAQYWWVSEREEEERVRAGRDALQVKLFKRVIIHW